MIKKIIIGFTLLLSTIGIVNANFEPTNYSFNYLQNSNIQIVKNNDCNYTINTTFNNGSGSYTYTGGTNSLTCTIGDGVSWYYSDLTPWQGSYEDSVVAIRAFRITNSNTGNLRVDKTILINKINNTQKTILGPYTHRKYIENGIRYLEYCNNITNSTLYRIKYNDFTEENLGTTCNFGNGSTNYISTRNTGQVGVHISPLNGYNNIVGQNGNALITSSILVSGNTDTSMSTLSNYSYDPLVWGPFSNSGKLIFEANPNYNTKYSTTIIYDNNGVLYNSGDYLRQFTKDSVTSIKNRRIVQLLGFKDPYFYFVDSPINTYSSTNLKVSRMHYYGNSQYQTCNGTNIVDLSGSLDPLNISCNNTTIGTGALTNDFIGNTLSNTGIYTEPTQTGSTTCGFGDLTCIDQEEQKSYGTPSFSGSYISKNIDEYGIEDFLFTCSQDVADKDIGFLGFLDWGFDFGFKFPALLGGWGFNISFHPFSPFSCIFKTLMYTKDVVWYDGEYDVVYLMQNDGKQLLEDFMNIKNVIISLITLAGLFLLINIKK